MTYHLSLFVEKILSPVVLVMPDGTTQKYASGKLAEEKVFDRRYRISSLRVVDDAVELQLFVDEFAPNSADDEQGFF